MGKLPRSQATHFNMDQGLFMALVFLIGFGFVQVYSSSFIFAIETSGDGYYFFRRQVLFGIVALALLVFFSAVKWEWIEKIVPWAWSVILLALTLTLIPGIGQKVGGASRWIQLPGFRLEPCELVKIFLPLYFAFLVETWPRVEKAGIKYLLAGSFLAPFGIFLLQPDFGSFFICVAMVGLTIFCMGLKWRYILTGIIAAVPMFYLLVMNVPYRRRRVLSFLDPWADPAQSGFQVIQSLLGLNAGGVTGQGLGNAQSKLFFLPEAHTDFTLAVLGEEWGVIGVVGLLLIYALVIFKGFRISLSMQDRRSQLSALGLTLLLFLQVVINSGVVLGLLPPKGLTLPFLSYGGSSLICLGLGMGILLNLSRRCPS